MQINRDLYFVIFDYYSIFKAISFFEMCLNNKSIDVSKINLAISLFIFFNYVTRKTSVQYLMLNT